MARSLLRALFRLIVAGRTEALAHDALPHAHWDRGLGGWVTHEDPGDAERAA